VIDPMVLKTVSKIMVSEENPSFTSGPVLKLSSLRHDETITSKVADSTNRRLNMRDAIGKAEIFLNKLIYLSSYVFS
jgi:hypothetical protein